LLLLKETSNGELILLFFLALKILPTPAGFQYQLFYLQASNPVVLHFLPAQHIRSHLFLAKYSAYNHKRATAAKCRESHHRRTDATTAVPFPDRGGVTHGILQRWRTYDCTRCI
jgi:hypothetical protein